MEKEIVEVFLFQMHHIEKVKFSSQINVNYVKYKKVSHKKAIDIRNNCLGPPVSYIHWSYIFINLFIQSPVKFNVIIKQLKIEYLKLIIRGGLFPPPLFNSQIQATKKVERKINRQEMLLIRLATFWKYLS